MGINFIADGEYYDHIESNCLLNDGGTFLGQEKSWFYDDEMTLLCFHVMQQRAIMWIIFTTSYVCLSYFWMAGTNANWRLSFQCFFHVSWSTGTVCSREIEWTVCLLSCNIICITMRKIGLFNVTTRRNRSGLPRYHVYFRFVRLPVFRIKRTPCDWCNKLCK